MRLGLGVPEASWADVQARDDLHANKLLAVQRGIGGSDDLVSENCAEHVQRGRGTFRSTRRVEVRGLDA